MKEIYDDVIEKMRDNEPLGECLNSVMEITGMDADNSRLAWFMKTGSELVYKHFFTIADGLSFTGIVNVDRIASEAVLLALQISMVLGYLFGANNAAEHLCETQPLEEELTKEEFDKIMYEIAVLFKLPEEFLKGGDY